MKRAVRQLVLILLLVTLLPSRVRLKDITTIENTNQISLIGYGLVIGLNGTGDRSSGSRGSAFTVQTISNMLEKFGITIPPGNLRTRNVAAVMVSSKTPVFGRVGTQFDVTVSSLGDATSLEGGVLLMTPLMGMDGTYYAQAQGAVSIGGYNIETVAGEKLRKNHALVGRVPNGATLKTTLQQTDFSLEKPVRLLLTDPDFVTASRIADEINLQYGAYTAGAVNDKSTKAWLAHPLNSGVVELTHPDSIDTVEKLVFFIADVETLWVDPDIEARVVINERTGTIVAGGNVRISEVMVSHGNLTIHTSQRPIISQPGASFSNAGETVVVPITKTSVDEEASTAAVVPETTSVSDLAAALNEMGVKPRDIIAIFQALKVAGALNAKLIIM